MVVQCHSIVLISFRTVSSNSNVHFNALKSIFIKIVSHVKQPYFTQTTDDHK